MTDTPDATAFLDLTGEVDRAAVHDLFDRAEELRLRRASHIHVDLSEITSIDPTDAAAVLFTLVRLRRSGSDVRVAGLRHPTLVDTAREVLVLDEIETITD
jgi:ABC-type transporter Mla MlaB component